MSYKTIHTTYGLQRMAQAEATGIEWEYAQGIERNSPLVQQVVSAPANRASAIGSMLLAAALSPVLAHAAAREFQPDWHAEYPCVHFHSVRVE